MRVKVVVLEKEAEEEEGGGNIFNKRLYCGESKGGERHLPSSLSLSPPPSFSLSLSLPLSPGMCALVFASHASPGSAVVRCRHRWAGKRRESGCIWPKENGRSLDRHARLTSGSDHQRLSLTLALSLSLSVSLSFTHTRARTHVQTHTCALRLTYTHAGWMSSR